MEEKEKEKKQSGVGDVLGEMEEAAKVLDGAAGGSGVDRDGAAEVRGSQEGVLSEAGRKRARRRDAGSNRMSFRDRQLLISLAVARYLSADQVARLFFPNKHESSCVRRLAQLAGTAKSGAF